MRKTSGISIGLVALLATAGIAYAQQTTIGSPGAPGIAGETPRTAVDLSDQTLDQWSKFGNYDALKARVKQWGSKGKSIGELLAQDKADAVALVATLKLSCTVGNAILVAVDNQAHTKTYEVACQGGAGYFLVQSDLAKPSGFSCFAADAARQADIAAHREPALTCSLPENAGLKIVAASILSRTGNSCAIKEIKWRGQSATTDFLELACEEGSGFIVRSPLPGSQAPMRVDRCDESARNGVACRLPANDTALATFKKVLAQHKVSCDAEAVRIIGHEAVKRRQVVEYFCPTQQPHGLVAFLPAEGSTEPFEALDCASAAKRQVVCSLTKLN